MEGEQAGNILSRTYVMAVWLPFTYRTVLPFD